MSGTATKQALMNNNGGILTLVPFPKFTDSGLPDISVADDIQRYDIGTRFKLGDRTYHYCKAYGTQIPDVGSQPYYAQAVANCAVQAAAAKGDSVVYITTAATDGKAHNGLILEDELKGGTIVIFPATTNHAIVRGIVANSLTVVSQSNTMMITLDAPLPFALTTGATAECCFSPFYLVATAASQVKTTTCVPSLAATDQQYFWGQTWGPCWVAPAATVGTGNDNPMVQFAANGSLVKEATGNITDQVAGFVLFQTYGGGQGAPFINLMLFP